MLLLELHDTLDAIRGDMPVVYNDGRIPDELCTWRGRYEQLTLTWREDGALPTVGHLQALCADALAGKVFEGYKGGQFTMKPFTPVWSDEWGEYVGWGIDGVVIKAGQVVLQRIFVGDYV